MDSQVEMNTAPTREISVQGLAVTVKQPYTEGHVITPSEAYALNQTFAENIGNNVRALINKLLKEHTKDKIEELPHEVLRALRAKAEEYSDSYEFSISGRGGPRAPVDPVAREAFKIAGDILRGHLKKKEIKLADLPEGKFEELVQGILTKNPQIEEEAKRRVENRKELADSLLDI